jgi:hypothetical protein
MKYVIWSVVTVLRHCVRIAWVVTVGSYYVVVAFLSIPRGPETLKMLSDLCVPLSLVTAVQMSIKSNVTWGITSFAECHVIIAT